MARAWLSNSGGASRFSVGDDLFGQLLITSLGSAGTYAEYVAATVRFRNRRDRRALPGWAVL